MEDIEINIDDFEDVIADMDSLPKTSQCSKTKPKSLTDFIIRKPKVGENKPTSQLGSPINKDRNQKAAKINTTKTNSIVSLAPLTLSLTNSFNLSRPHYLRLDFLKSQKWHYPSSVEQRDYQVRFSESCIKQNTLVVLPTGLGKTLIAGVTMLNYIRWFPNSKVIFLAPTRPLVAQQQEAITSLLNIDVDKSVVLTGVTNVQKRKRIWRDCDKLFIFSTAHCLSNDLDRCSVDIKQISLIIVDEAHKAGNAGEVYNKQVIENSFENSVVEDINEEETNNCYKNIFNNYVNKFNSQMRIVGLTATPGNGLESTLNLIKALRISELSVKTEGDVKKHLFNKNIEEITVVNDEDSRVTEARKLITELLQQVLNRLLAKKVFWHKDAATLKKFTLFNAYQKNKHLMYVIGDFCLGISLVNLRDVLETYGINDVIKNINKNFNGAKVSRNKMLLKNKPAFQRLMQVLSECTNKSSPKVDKLLELLRDHFNRNKRMNSNPDAKDNHGHTGVIVFTSLRSSADELVSVISKIGLKTEKLVGQAAQSMSDQGQTQKRQKEIVDQFRNGHADVLVSTCVGEEGLDIGAVDLIVNFDSVNSFTRLVQRRGRTGRKRDGRVVSLVTDEEKQNNERRSGMYNKLQSELKDICSGSELKKGSAKYKIREELKYNRKYGKCFPLGFNPKFEIFTVNDVDIQIVKNERPKINEGFSNVFVTASEVKRKFDLEQSENRVGIKNLGQKNNEELINYHNNTPNKTPVNHSKEPRPFNKEEKLFGYNKNNNIKPKIANRKDKVDETHKNKDKFNDIEEKMKLFKELEDQEEFEF